MINKFFNFKCICVLVVIQLLISCSGKKSGHSGNSNDLVQKSVLLTTGEDGSEVNRLKNKNIDGVIFEVLYKPLAYVISEGENVEPSFENIEKFKHEYDGLVYFDLRIKTSESQVDLLKELSNNAQEYEGMIKYCSFEIQKDMSLVNSSGISVQCVHSHFERSYGILPGLTFLAAFPKGNESNEDLTFTLNDKLFGKGPIKFHFTSAELKEPELP